MLTIPYSKLALTVALLSIDAKILNDELLAKCSALSITTDNKRELNVKVAEYNGISVEMLINSINYEKLMEDYRIYNVNEMVKVMENNGLNNEQAWGIVAVASGLIDID